MDLVTDATTRTFIEVSEVWVPESDRLVLAAGTYGSLENFASVSGSENFAKGEGLPGKAWAEARPIAPRIHRHKERCPTPNIPWHS